MTDSCDQSGPSRAEQLIELGALSMSSAREGAVHTICLFGELALGTTDRVDAELQRVEATDAWMIVVDLSGLTFISSAGVQLLVDAEVRSRADSQRLALLRGPPAVQRVLEICGVGAALPFATRWAASGRT
ncbi:MAG TPA: STAS domain-containing protein [Solirubrobacteraceae bacterium]|nr:STAS domain-containing protein [Solirubrobacteraceae bacterium]